MNPIRAALVLLALCYLGCAATGRRPMSKSAETAYEEPESARQRLSQLEGRVARNASRLGLTEMAAHVERAEPQPAAPDAMAEARRKPPTRCELVASICRDAQRICRIAHFLEEEDARQSCLRARQTCKKARQSTAC